MEQSSLIGAGSVTVLWSFLVGVLGVPGGDAPGDASLEGVVNEGLGARMMGTEAGRTLSASEPSCVGELLRLLSEGSGGCSMTQTCCVVGGDMTLGVAAGATLAVTGGLLGWLSCLSDTEEEVKSHQQ